MKKVPIIDFGGQDPVKLYKQACKSNWCTITKCRGFVVWKQCKGELVIELIEKKAIYYDNDPSRYQIAEGYDSGLSRIVIVVKTFATMTEALKFIIKEKKKHNNAKEWTKFPRSELSQEDLDELEYGW